MSKRSNRDRKNRSQRPFKARNQSRAIEYVGTISMTREGFGFLEVMLQEGQTPVDDIFIPARKLGGALHGDVVRVAVIPRSVRSGHKAEGEVFHVLERSKRPYVGILQIVEKQAYVITDSRNMPYDILVAKGALHGARSGEKVAVLVTDWDKKNYLPVGNVVDVLGAPGENNTEMHAILAEFGLPYRFEEDVENESNDISEEILPDEIKQRRDFRGIPTFTIDPADAKDFDDALSIRQIDECKSKKASGKVWEVGIHIADVSYYVLPGTLTDTAAYERGNSVYLVDRTVPMLPEKLSNKLCSLRPHEDKLCFSAVFELDEKAHVLSHWFGRTVICSSCRMAYEEAQEVLEGKEIATTAESGEIPQNIKDGLHNLHKLAGLLRDDRFRQGAIAFERPEVKVQVDAEGRPVGVNVKEMKDSNWLIEEFMLLANREVAAFIGKKKSKATDQAPVFVYRVHEAPTEDKMEAFQNFVHHFGYKMTKTKSSKDYATKINALLESIKDKPEASGIVMMALRSMARAHYTTHNVGHYGLAFDYYTHFTSPIRRYSDLMVHRLLALYMDGGNSVEASSYEMKCTHLSQREQLATEAERASVKYKMVEYMQDKVGMIFDGIVSGLTDWGMYVELDQTQIEGMIPLREMEEDYFEFDEETFSLVGTHTGKRYEMGQKVRVQVVRANLEQKQLDYKLITD